MSFWRDRSVFVTGCTGFLGWRLVEELVSKGARVTGLVRDVVPRAPFFSRGLDREIAVVPGSLEDYELLERAVADYEIDTVFHLAAQAIVPIANRNPRSTFETNIRGTWNVLESCRRASTVTRIIAASSDKAYGSHQELPYTEEHPLAGTHPYDVSKSCADLIATTYHRTYDTPVSVTRCGNLFGPGDTNFSRIVPGTIRSVLRGEPPLIRSDGTPVRDYVYVDDVVQGYLLLAERMEEPSVRGQAYNFGTGEPLSVLELTARISRLAGRGDLEPRILNQARAEIQAQFLSFERAERILGWRPTRSVTERLEETIDWYRDCLSATPEGRT
jgi:CDP-glucose 4,6-dehydratase